MSAEAGIFNLYFIFLSFYVAFRFFKLYAIMKAKRKRIENMLSKTYREKSIFD